MFSTSTIVQLKCTVWACQRHLSVTVCLGHWGQKGPQLFFKADFFIYVWTMFSLRVWSTGGLAFQFLWEVCARRHGLMINHRGKVWKTLWTTSKVQCLVKWELQCLVKWETVFDYSLSGHFVLFHNVLCPVTGSLWKRTPRWRWLRQQCCLPRMAGVRWEVKGHTVWTESFANVKLM